MGEIYVGELDGKWKAGGVPLVSTGSGYVPGRYVWRHNGTQWVSVWQRDTTAPDAPTVSASIVAGTKNKLAVRVKHGGGGPIKRTVVKVAWDGTWPSNPGTVDGHYLSQSYNGEPWSEYWLGNSDVSGADGTKYLPDFYQTFSIPLSTWVRVAAWAQDDFYNWSAAGNAQVATLNPDPPAPVLREVDAAFNPDDAGEWSENHGYWTTSGTQNGYGSAGGEYALGGYWFYNGKVQQHLPNMVNGLEARVYIARVNSAHGVSGAATAHYGVHRHPSKPGRDPYMAGHYSDISLARGQGAWTALSTGWMGEMKGGSICGLAIGLVGRTAYTSPWYMKCYGRGTVGGQWYMRWQQY